MERPTPIRITEGALHHNYLLVESAAFPADAIGGSNIESAGKQFKIITDDGQEILTDYDGTKGFLRNRQIGQYYSRNHLKQGDMLYLHKRGDYEYYLAKSADITRVILFKYSESGWGTLEKIQKAFSKGYDFQTYYGTSYNSLRPQAGDTCICLCNDTDKITFITKIRSPSRDEGVYDYIEPLFLAHPVVFSEDISSVKPYILFKPQDAMTGLTRAVFFSVSEFPQYLDRIREKLLERNPEQAIEISRYFPYNASERKPLIEQSTLGPATHANTLHPHNTILFGPPGTGKTYVTKQLALKIISTKV